MRLPRWKDVLRPCHEAQCLDDLCQAVPTEGAFCTDLNKCTVNDACTCMDDGRDEVVCLEEPKSRDDGENCTKDSCKPTTGCVYEPVEGTCDDKNPCTHTDTCLGGE